MEKYDIAGQATDDNIVRSMQWHTEGGGLGSSTPTPPRNSEGPPKNRAKLNPTVKTVKNITEFMMPAHQDVQKKRQ